MPDPDKVKRDAAVRLTLKSLETGDSKYANQALKIGNLKDAYAKLGVLDRVILNMGRMDLQSQGKPSQDPGELYRAGQTYLHEYYNQELIKTRTGREAGELEKQKFAVAQKPFLKNIDLTGNMLGPAYSQGKKNWTLEEFATVTDIKYKLALAAIAGQGQGRGGDESAFPEIVKNAKARIEKVRDEYEKKYAVGGLTPKASEQIWKELTKRLNDPSDPTLRNDWLLWYNYSQAIVGLPPDGEARFQEIIQFPAKGLFARTIRLFFHDFAMGPAYQAPPISGLITPQQRAAATGAAQTATQQGVQVGESILNQTK